MRLDLRCSRETLERVRDDRVPGEALDGEDVARLERDRVAQADPLEHGRDLVVAVRLGSADDQREVDLGRRVGARHRSAWASATNSGGASASARTAASRPIAWSAAAPCSRVAAPASASELASVLRRWAKAPSTTGFTPLGTPGATRSKATRAEATFGR